MKLTQGTFSYLPDLTEAQIRKQLDYILAQGWAVSLEYTDDPHPRNTFWEILGRPLLDLRDATSLMREVEACRTTYPKHYIKVNAFDSTHGIESLRLSFIVNRPSYEPGFRLERAEAAGRTVRYTTRSYAADRPSGERY
ncbi:MAG: ribulose bisphosphate carboxylase small subunit [Gammaproteobacteria bacterium]|nr:ribulose bisphosphate carboxylase small subunit [Gammaproteobacteria bacterium]